MPEPYPENTPGDFYVERDCCTLCEVPRRFAPDLFTYAEIDGRVDHCYVSKQPSDDHELDDMLEVIRCAELRCIRYRGTDEAVLSRIEAMGEEAVCDALGKPPEKSQRPWWRFW